MPEVNIEHEAVSYTKETRTFSVELSSLGDRNVEQACTRRAPILVSNPETGVSRIMHWQKNDTDGSGEDIYGYNYEGKGTDGKPFKFLFIND